MSLNTLTHALQQLLFTHKDILGKALERNECLCVIYMNHIADLVPDPEMLKFGDEVHKDERTSNR